MRDINHTQSAKIKWHTQQCIVTKTVKKKNLAIKPCITYQHQIRYQMTQFPITRNSCNSHLQSNKIIRSLPNLLHFTAKEQSHVHTRHHLSATKSISNLTRTLQPGKTHSLLQPTCNYSLMSPIQCTSQLLSRPHVLSNPST